MSESGEVNDYESDYDGEIDCGSDEEEIGFEIGNLR